MFCESQLCERVLLSKVDGNMRRMKKYAVHSLVSSLEICDDD
jgi:hypothetical protein